MNKPEIEAGKLVARWETGRIVCLKDTVDEFERDHEQSSFWGICRDNLPVDTALDLAVDYIQEVYREAGLRKLTLFAKVRQGPNYRLQVRSTTSLTHACLKEIQRLEYNLDPRGYGFFNPKQEPGVDYTYSWDCLNSTGD